MWKRDTEHPASICLVPIEGFMGRAEAKEVILLIREGDEEMAFCMCSCDFLLYQAKEVKIYFPKLFSSGEIASVRNTQCQHRTYAVIWVCAGGSGRKEHHTCDELRKSLRSDTCEERECKHSQCAGHFKCS